MAVGVEYEKVTAPQHTVVVAGAVATPVEGDQAH